MIESLHISNYALIDNVDINFHEGLNIITGETGAGKSIILGALSLILGGRADSKVVRNPEKKSVIEAVFSVKNHNLLKEYCISNDIEWDDAECILRREIAPGGRSRAFINDSPVTLQHLQAVAVQLVDIHSQHQNQLLSSSEYQLRIIDSLAGNDDRLKEYATHYFTFRNAVKRLKETRELLAKSKADAEYIRFQHTQLKDACLEEGEQEELERDRELLSNMTEIKEYLSSATTALSDGRENVLSLLKEAIANCAELNDVLEDAEALTERLETARIEIQDIADTLADYDNDLTADPQELERIEERLSEIYTLQHKHKVDSVKALIDLRERLATQLDAIENSDDTLLALERTAKNARENVMNYASEISHYRELQATKFAQELKERALPLGMRNLRCEIAVTQSGEITASGIDHIEFLFSFNKNQPLLPVGGTASGGEISRLMLSIKSIIADKMQLPSIIFDEVDTGVSGDVANRMGEMMKEISRNIQVIAITHLPQVASKGDYHYKVFKEDDETATHTRINLLNNEQRVDELAVMLSGSTVNEAARANAISLLNNQ